MTYLFQSVLHVMTDLVKGKVILKGTKYANMNIIISSIFSFDSLFQSIYNVDLQNDFRIGFHLYMFISY